MAVGGGDSKPRDRRGLGEKFQASLPSSWKKERRGRSWEGTKKRSESTNCFKNPGSKKKTDQICEQIANSGTGKRKNQTKNCEWRFWHPPISAMAPTQIWKTIPGKERPMEVLIPLPVERGERGIKKGDSGCADVAGGSARLSARKNDRGMGKNVRLRYNGKG